MFVIIAEKEFFPDKEDTNHARLLLALLNRNFDFQRSSNIVFLTYLEGDNTFKELNNLKNLKAQLIEAKAAEMSNTMDGLSFSHPNKQGEF
ncbi:urotensin-2B [Rhynchocyon petersi]